MLDLIDQSCLNYHYCCHQADHREELRYVSHGRMFLVNGGKAYQRTTTDSVNK